MKERYLTLENIDKKSNKWLKNLLAFRKRRNVEFHPNNSALLIMDMQKYFLDKSSHAYIPSASAIIPNIKNLMDAFLKRNFPVFFTRHIDEENIESSMNKWWKNSLRETDTLSEIIPELNHPDAIIIKKSHYDALYQTPLEKLLKEKGIKQIVITGVMTHLCCETTARSSFMRGFMVFFPIGGSATYNENFHWATLLNLSHGFAIPILCKELINSLKRFE